MELTPTVAVHLAAATAALATGPVALYARLGPRPRPLLHRIFGRLWVGLMVVTAISALFLRDTGLPNIAGFTPVHLLVLLTFGALARAFLKLARGDLRGHAATMRWLYFAACVGAGAFTLLPHRLLGSLLWPRVAGLVPIVQNTPPWVGLLLAALLFAGWVQSRDRNASFTSVTAAPVAMALFSLWATSRYVAAVRLALHPSLAADPWFALPVAMLYGAFSGMFVGRAAQLWRLAFRPAIVHAA